MRKRRAERLIEFHTNNIQLGIEQGIYRQDMNTEMVPQIILMMSEIIFENNILQFENICHPDFIKEMLIYHLHGIVNEKGLKYLEKKTKK